MISPTISYHQLPAMLAKLVEGKEQHVLLQQIVVAQRGGVSYIPAAGRLQPSLALGAAVVLEMDLIVD